MFLKVALTFLTIGALSVNALTTPVARSPAPEPEPQELKAGILLSSRELQAPNELFSREPEDWAGSARDHYMAKRGQVISSPNPPPPPRKQTIKPVEEGPVSKFAQLKGSELNPQTWHPILEGHPRTEIPPIMNKFPPPPKPKRELLD